MNRKNKQQLVMAVDQAMLAAVIDTLKEEGKISKGDSTRDWKQILIRIKDLQSAGVLLDSLN